jgi:hypothetical protein
VQQVTEIEGDAAAGGRWCYFRDAEGEHLRDQGALPSAVLRLTPGQPRSLRLEAGVRAPRRQCINIRRGLSARPRSASPPVRGS